MKKKIGELYNKPIVEGDKNLVKDYEIHINDLISGKNKEDNIKTVYYEKNYEDRKELYNYLNEFLTPYFNQYDSVFVNTITIIPDDSSTPYVFNIAERPNSAYINLWYREKGMTTNEYVISISPEREDYNIFYED